jgi:hypothetical protein
VTLQKSAPHKKQRWLSLLVVVATLSVLGASVAQGHGATSIPAAFAGGIQVDVHGANDVPGQVDVTQMGRDTSANPDVHIFWSWDSISSWTGNGQTGDACALFDTGDTDAFINYVVCARVQNRNADPNDPELLPASANHPAYLFDCSNKKNDRCTNPAPRTYTAGGVLAGPLGTALNQSGAGNLATHTDPFLAGESYPHDTSIELLIDDSLVPTGVSLANVCSYPSAGNGGNNNPFDCIVTPGVQYGTLRVTKTITNDNGGSKVFSDFSFTAGSGTSTTGVIASTAFDADGVIETTVPVGTYSVTEVGTPISGYTTGYSNCTSVSVTAGNTSTCAITNDDDIAAPTIATTMKWTLNDASTLTGFVAGGGVSTVTFDLYKDTATETDCQTTPVYTETVNVDDTDGSAATTTGWPADDGTYKWIASFSGNSRNAATATSCGDEVTTLP